MAMTEDEKRKAIAAAPVSVVRPTAESFSQKPAVSFIEPQDINAVSPRPRAPGESRGSQFLRDARYQFTPEGRAKQYRENFPNATTATPQAAPGTPPPLTRPAATAAPAAALAAAATPTPAASAPTPPAPKGPGVQFNTGQPGDVQPPTQPTIGSFTGSNGVTREFTRNQAEAMAGKLPSAPAAAIPPAPAAAAGVNTPPPLTRPTPTAVAQGVAQGIRSQALTARNDAAQALNPMSAQGELLRRLENSQNSYFNKGSPSARAFAAEAILGQIRAGNAASAAGQAGATAALQQGGTGEMAAGAQANELGDRSAARNQQATLTREALDAQAPTVTLANGQAARAGRDGVVRNLVGEDGQPVSLRAQDKTLDPNEVFKSVTAAQQAILTDPTMTPEARTAALKELDASPAGQAVAALLSSPQGAQASQVPTLEEFLPAAQRANPNMTEQQLRAEYEKAYGSR